jgi:hypothetical protein
MQLNKLETNAMNAIIIPYITMEEFVLEERHTGNNPTIYGVCAERLQ